MSQKFLSEASAAASGAPKIYGAEISGWPILKIQYLTDPEGIAKLLPPGIEPGAEPKVYISFYNVPIHEAPEYGTVVSVAAKFNGVEGEYTLFIAISQEEPMLLCQELWGQPKYLADTTYFRFGDTVEAKISHQGYTFMEFKGQIKGQVEIPEFEEINWWVKKMRGGDYMNPTAWSYPPHVMRIWGKYGTEYAEKVEGTLKLRESPWDPMTEYLPIRSSANAYLWSPKFIDRTITVAGPLDADKFLPYADTISGSRWPGQNGGPKKHG
jgi:acetoacetate decarboxylase